MFLQPALQRAQVEIDHCRELVLRTRLDRALSGLQHAGGIGDAGGQQEGKRRRVAGREAPAVAPVAQALGQRVDFIQVEVETLAQLQEALDAGVTMVLLDNMDLAAIRSAVEMAQGRCSLEISGGVTLETLAALAATGVDRISVGALIKDIQAVDFSMRFNPKPVEAPTDSPPDIRVRTGRFES